MFTIILDILIKPVWNFLREVILRNKSINDAFRTEKIRLILFCIVVSSISINVFLIPRVFQISKDYIDINKKYKDLLVITKVNCYKLLSK
jgi:hypothetical protein